MSAIAAKMNRSKSTISRELKRNIDKQHQVYLPDTAEEMKKTRRAKSKERYKGFDTATIEEVKQRLEQYHSPEQLAGRMKQEGLAGVSHETIYQMIYADHQGMGLYKQYLRQKQKQRRRKGVTQKRGRIPDRVGIEHRPEIAEKKIEIGHWESDTVIGCNHAGVVVTHVDKASKYLLAGLAKNKTMAEVNRITLKLFEKVKPAFRKTMTFDNGREFCGHEKLSKSLDLECFFATPYHSWERGLNEHTNGLLRQYFPKSTNFKTVKAEDVKRAVDSINGRPRKSLGYRTPREVFLEQLGAIALQN